jgi:hypothetical protein
LQLRKTIYLYLLEIVMEDDDDDDDSELSFGLSARSFGSWLRMPQSFLTTKSTKL